MFGMWRGLTGLSTCVCLLMLIHFSPHAGKECDFLLLFFCFCFSPVSTFTKGTTQREGCSLSVAAHLNIKLISSKLSIFMPQYKCVIVCVLGRLSNIFTLQIEMFPRVLAVNADGES